MVNDALIGVRYRKRLESDLSQLSVLKDLDTGVAGMTLKKFVSIKNVGRFHDASAAGDVDLRKFNLVYGENGRGKTTICAVLRSLQSGDGRYIAGRQTLGAADAPRVKVLLEAPTPIANFQDGTWSQTVPALAIFDQQFVSDNVYLGDGVGAEQKRNLYKVIVGQDAVGKAQRMDVLVADIRKASASIRDAKRSVESHLVPGLKFADLMEAVPDPEIDKKIAKLDADILNASATIVLAKSIPFALIELPPLVDGIAAVLSSTIGSVSASADARFRDHFAHHKMQSGGQAWIAQGLEYDVEKECAFCGQDLAAGNMVEVYKVIFSEGYRTLKDDITARGKRIADQFDAHKINFTLQPLGDLAKTIELWKPLADFVPPEGPPVEEAQRVVADYREQLLRVFRAKHQAPLEPIDLDAEALAAVAEYQLLLSSLAAYNVAAATANAELQVRQAELKQIDPETAKSERERLLILKKQHAEGLKVICADYARLEEAKAAQEAERDAIKADLDTHSGDVVGRYQNAINRYLDLFNAGFSIAKVDHNYVGGVNASYHLMINRVAVPLGDEKTPLDMPSFKNTLSAGDKSTLALALFLAQLENDPSRGERIVVFDDPFNSQDSFRRNQTAIEIVRTIPSVAQVVVLSHDARFLKEMADKAFGIQIKTLKLNPVGETTEISELDLEEMLKAEVRVLVDILQSYFAGTGRVQTRDVIQKIRPLLETYCRNSCITLFQPNDILSDILTAIRTTGETHPLWRIYQDLSDINDYTCRYHHADGTVTGVIDETELRGYTKRTLRLVGAMGG